MIQNIAMLEFEGQMISNMVGLKSD